MTLSVGESTRKLISWRDIERQSERDTDRRKEAQARKNNDGVAG